jgi:hypothetical protein
LKSNNSNEPATRKGGGFCYTQNPPKPGVIGQPQAGATAVKISVAAERKTMTREQLKKLGVPEEAIDGVLAAHPLCESCPTA